MANNAPWYIQRAERNGSPLPGAKLYAYVVNTTIPKVIYADVTLETPLVTPLVANGDGLYPQYFLGSGEYTFVETDANDVQNGDPRNYVSATDGGPLDPNGPGFGALFEKESFPVDEIIWLPDLTNEWWRDDGCFCWIFPAQNFTTINYIKSIFGNNNGHITGRYSIWGFLGESETKLADNPLPDSDVVGVESLNQLDISPYTYIGVAMDPGHDIGGGMPIRQNSLVYPTNPGPTNAPAAFGFIGQHAQNTEFSSWPTIKGADPKYLITKWMALGLSY